MYIPKKRVAEIRKERLQEPALDRQEQDLFEEGIRLFNARRYWDAHECWESVWRRREEESRIFFQGIIQAAAGFHLVVEKPRPGGASKNLSKALEKLDLFPTWFLGIDVALLRDAIRTALRAIDQSGEVKLPVLNLKPET
ncbi:MAG: DUF309 domain-containing protein [Bacteroidota bacterium]